MSQSVVQDWLAEKCTLRQQATILSALRGCDGLSKEDPSKAITRALRKTILIPADPNHSNDPNNTFMSEELTQASLDNFLDDLDKYPIHFVMHLMQAAMLIGWFLPGTKRKMWFSLYLALCNRMHLLPEPLTQTKRRLRDGRRTELEERGARARI